MDLETLLARSGVIKHFQAELERYQCRLVQLPLSPHTKEAYRSRLNNFLGFIASADRDYSRFFSDPACRALAVREYKSHIKDLEAKPASVNSALTAIDHFFAFLGFAKSKSKRERLPALSPRALSRAEQSRLLVLADHARPIDRAIIYLLLYSGIRLSECAALNITDLLVSERKGRVIVRQGKGGLYRDIPLNSDARRGIAPWLTERAKRESRKGLSNAVFLNPQGKRMSRRSIDKAVRKIGFKCGLELSAHVLRHSCLTNLARSGTDLGIVSQIAGHKKLETTKRYTLPTEADLEAAMEGIVISD
jgi:integrase/recombinase XerC